MDSYLQGRFTDRVYNHRVLIKAHYERWRGGRVVDGSGLENQHVRKGIVGSNPTLSVLPPAWGALNDNFTSNRVLHLFDQLDATKRGRENYVQTRKAVKNILASTIETLSYKYNAYRCYRWIKLCRQESAAVDSTKAVRVKGIMFCIGISPCPSSNTRDNSLNCSTNTKLTESCLRNNPERWSIRRSTGAIDVGIWPWIPSGQCGEIP